MKKLSSIVLALSLASFVGCKKEEAAAPAPAPTPAPAPVEAKPAEVAPTPAPVAMNIIDTAKAAGNFNTLIAAVEAAGLVETLNGAGPFTVFAPTDEAFAKIAKADLDALLANKDKLKAVLTYHVVAGNKMAADVTGAKELATVNGAALAIDTTAGVKVGGATVVKTDIAASNGTIHVIDTVLMPKM